MARLVTEGTKRSRERDGAVRFRLWLTSTLFCSRLWEGIFLCSNAGFSRDDISHLSPPVLRHIYLTSAMAASDEQYWFDTSLLS